MKEGCTSATGHKGMKQEDARRVIEALTSATRWPLNQGRTLSPDVSKQPGKGQCLPQDPSVIYLLPPSPGQHTIGTMLDRWDYA